MAIDPSVRQRLFNNNPFSSNAAGDPHKNRYPDVESIDQKVSHLIINTIAQKQKYPGDQLAVAVLGETGSGKTHLISRLVKAGTSGADPFFFAYIRPFIDPKRTYRYLLREIVADLDRKIHILNRFSQLEYVCGRVFIHVLFEVAELKSDEGMRALARACLDNPEKTLKLKVKPEKRGPWCRFTYRLLKDRHADLDTHFLNVLTQYLFEDQKRSAAGRWMMGKSIDAEDCRLLAVPHRSGHTSEDLEDEARRILMSLDLILDQYGNRPLVVFFDQLENLQGRALLEKFKQLIYLLSDTTRAMMPIAFFRGLDWEKRFLPEMDDTIVSRFKGNLFLLEGCTLRQARSIVERRLEMALTDLKRPDPLYPFYPEFSRKFETSVNPKIKWPRQVISRTNQLLLSILEIDAVPKNDHQVLSTAFKMRCREVLSKYDRFEPDESRLLLALELYLSHRPADSAYALKHLKRPGNSRHIDLTGILSTPSGDTCQVAFLIDMDLHHSYVRARLRRGLDFLGRTATHRAIYIRDLRCDMPALPKWPATNQLLKELEKKGGYALFLDKEAAAVWYALALLKFDVEAGDVTREDGSVIGVKQLERFVAACLLGDKYPAFAALDRCLGGGGKPSPAQPSPPAETPESTKIPESAVALLKEVPVKMMKAEWLAAKLAARLHRAVSVDNLVRELQNLHDRFSLIQAVDGTIIKLKMEWLNAQS